MDISALRRSIEGTVIGRSDAAYESARHALSWNVVNPAPSPDAIIRVASDADVAATVGFARTHGLRVAISGGGHGLCAAPPADAALLLDLTQLDRVKIDRAARRASVQAVTRNRDLARTLGEYDLAFPYGHCSTVALSGYLLSGGFGWNTGQWGPACFSVEAVDVVLADGRLVTATDREHADVLWAARGAGLGFFGVATRYELVVYPHPRAIWTSTSVYPLARAAEIAAWLFERRVTLPSNLETMLAITAAPDSVAARCTDSGGKACLVNTAVFAASEHEARDILALVDSAGDEAPLERMTARAASFGTLFDGMDQLFPAHHRYLAHTVGSEQSPSALIAAIEAHIRAAPSPRSLILCPIIAPPPPSAPAPPATAFSIAPTTFMMAYAIWDDATADRANRAWHAGVADALEPFASSHYIGETDIVARPERAARCFAPANWQRLLDLRRQYDPDGVFRTLLPRTT